MGWTAERRFWLGLAVAAAIFAFAAQDHYARFPRGWLTDDAYFYPQIARHIARSGFSSFDGIHPTDGYHLAWGWALAGVSWLAGRVAWSSDWQLGVMVTFYLFLALAMGRLFGRDPLHGFWLAWTGVVFKMMMETTLLALVLLALARDRFLGGEAQQTRWWPTPLLALVPLIRIDAVGIAGVCSLAQWVRDRNLRALGWNLAWLAVGMALQLGAMKLLSGHWLSVSAEVKASTLSLASIRGNVVANLTGNYLANLLSWLIALAFWAVAALGLGWPRDRLTRARQTALAAPLLFCLFHLLTNNTIRYWYFVPLLAMSVWMSGAHPSSSRSLRGLSHMVFGAAVLAFLGKSVVDGVVRREQIRWSAEFVRETRGRLAASDPVFQVDATGWTAWHSGLPVVNGDGLVNTHQFAERLRRGRLSGYLQEEGIRYVISNQVPRDGLVVDQGGLKVPLDSVEILIPPPAGFPPRTAFGLYRLR